MGVALLRMEIDLVSYVDILERAEEPVAMSGNSYVSAVTKPCGPVMCPTPRSNVRSSVPSRVGTCN